MRFYWFMISSFLFLGCKTMDSSADIEKQKPTDIREVEQIMDSQIVFLYFEIESKKDGTMEIHLLESQVVDGRMKENTIRQAKKTEKNLLVQLLDEKNQVEVEQIIENPLFRTMEHYSEDGEITLNQSELDKTLFFIRFNHKNTIKTLRIYTIQYGVPVEVYHKPIQL